MLKGINISTAEDILSALPEIIAAIPGGLEMSALIRAKVASLEAQNPELFSVFHDLIHIHLDQFGTGNIDKVIDLILPAASLDPVAAVANLQALTSAPVDNAPASGVSAVAATGSAPASITPATPSPAARPNPDGTFGTPSSQPST